MCTYKNQNYSEGSIIKFDDGHYYQCFDGSWRLYQLKKSDKVKLVSKQAIEENKTFKYTYLCELSNHNSRNITVVSTNDIEAHILAIQEFETVCNDIQKTEKLIETLQIPTKEMTEEIMQIPNIPTEINGERMNYTNYSFYDDIYWSGDRLYGKWSQTLSGVCSGNGVFGFFYRIQITSDPTVIDSSCSGHYVAKIENQA